MRYIAHLCHGQILVRSLVLFITGRNEVVAQVIFLHLIVILFTGGGVSAPPRDQVHPARPGTPPKYGLRAAGTHPTGMHSCSIYFRF